MDFYLMGKGLLDKGLYAEAKENFIIGKSNGDIRCIYGIVASNELMKVENHAPIEELKAIVNQLKIMHNNNDGDASFILGRCYETGIISERNLELAIEYYLKSAENGNSDAMFNLACIYISTKNAEEKVVQDLLLSSARKGNPSACLCVGHICEDNELYDEALFWYKRSAENGSPENKSALSNFIKKREIEGK